ncbi:hypothetical protein E2C01_062573 [Portunus trituberculatus]|uniref:Uncharacterized protein n=1 Tax=Portunus trituberculatus TaxID=210409 RepID=A0A5B7HE21_PORTR|nr:hypothetical protein [Portunus trituberculatus]
MYGERRPVVTRELGGVGACMWRTISGHRVRPPDLLERRSNYVKSGAEDGRMLDTSEDNDTAESTYSDGDGDGKQQLMNNATNDAGDGSREVIKKCYTTFLGHSLMGKKGTPHWVIMAPTRQVEAFCCSSRGTVAEASTTPATPDHLRPFT